MLLELPAILTGLWLYRRYGSHWLGLAPGTIVVLGALTASASYIAAPVAVRHGIPQADIGLAMLASLGVTFPFNVLIGIGLYSYFTTYLPVV